MYNDECLCAGTRYGLEEQSKDTGGAELVDS
jgi:hypothetical protein